VKRRSYIVVSPAGRVMNLQDPKTARSEIHLFHVILDKFEVDYRDALRLLVTKTTRIQVKIIH